MFESFEGLQPQNVLIMFVFSTRSDYLLMVKISLDVFNCLQFLYAVQELGDSLHDVVYMYLHVRTKTIVIGIFCV